MSAVHGVGPSARTEHDLLGERVVPGDALYGIQTLRARENFCLSPYRLHPALVRALAMVKQAAALANRDTKDLPQPLAAAIVAAAERIRAGEYADQFVVDPIQGGAGTSINMNVNEVIANLALISLGHNPGQYEIISPNTHVNMAQSTNDAVPTAIRLAAIGLCDDLLAALDRLQEELQAVAERTDAVLKMGRTHLQDAVPIRMGQEFAAYRQVVARARRRLAAARQGLLAINLGATAVGTGLNARPEYTTRVVEHLRVISGLDLHLADDLVDATQNVDALVEVSSALKGLALSLIKMTNDLRLMASGPRAGLGEVHLPALQPGSSIMPGKVNPVIPEVVAQVSFRVLGNDVTVGLAAQAGQFELNVMQPVLAFALFESLEMLRRALDTLCERCLTGLVANQERCRAMAEAGVGVATALAPHLGYELASEVARKAHQSGCSVRAVCLELGLLDGDTLDLVLDPLAMTRPGIAGSHLLAR